MPKGRVKEYNPVKGYGIILMEDGSEIFVHGSAIQAKGLKVLAAGERVNLEISQGPQGPLAANVRRIDETVSGEEGAPKEPDSPGKTAPGRTVSPRGGGSPGRSSPSPGEDDVSFRASFFLPRFESHQEFARLRTLMGALRLGHFSPPPVTPLDPLPQDIVSAREAADLSSRGLDVVEGDVRLLPDGTLAFKDRRVLLYIRTPNLSAFDDLDIDESWRSFRRLSFGSEDGGPRFHIANCRTLEAMRQSGRGHRYVVSTRTDGQFELVSPGGSVTIRALRVCKNCLERLNWKGFVRVSGDERDRRVEAFSLREFFEAYGRAL
ncbi:MAG: cold-shock protein [Leptospirillia bacterium]